MGAAGINQEALAQAVGVSQGAVSGWLKGAIPSADKLARIARFFSVTPEHLLGDPDGAGGLKAPQPGEDWRKRALHAEGELRRLQKSLLTIAETILNPTQKS